MTTSPTSPAIEPLLLTIRFSSSLPDINLDIALRHRTTILALKHQLRTRIDSRSRLRLIHQGRILPDDAALSSVLKPLPPSDNDITSTPSVAKGKAKATDANTASRSAQSRVYVNCSIGAELSPQDLAAEKAAAQAPPLKPTTLPSSSSTGAAAAASTSIKRPSWSRPQRPRGFDRLLQAGFTQSEISTLRTQFASIHTERFAPDAMPSPDALRALEDSWIDSNAGEMPSSSMDGVGAGGFGGAGPLEEDLGNVTSVLDILVRGMMIGFFFPLGSLTWLLRQGIWGEKWQIFVGSGVVLSLAVGVVMGISGEH